jgi:DNA-binding CsgD family transcriptional regulator
MVIGSLQSQLEALGVDIVEVLEHSRWPVSIVDASGVCVWLNAAAIDLVGDQRGGSMSSIAEDYLPHARAALKRRQMGADALTHHGFVVIDRHGARRHLDLLSISLTRDDEFVGILSIVRTVTAEDSSALEPLSPRERETLALLAAGFSTSQVAERLGIAHETARNHIRGVLQALGVHSRGAAVARARELRLL